MVDTPPPPENPFANNENDPFALPPENGDGLDQGTPNVAAKPGRVLMVVGIVGAVLILLLYNIFFTEEKAPEVVAPKITLAPKTEAPPLPKEAPPLIQAPPPVIIAPPVPEPTNIEIIKPQDDAAAKAQALARIRSRMVLEDNGGGSSGGLLSSSTTPSASTPSDPNSSFEANVVRGNSKAEKVLATRLTDLNRTIAQGRIIQATMESALNTDLPAPIRAIVSRDTYAESGTTPLIPKGSRLIGTYNTSLASGQTRVFVVWTRVIRPDGVDVMINSPLVDQIGQAGVGGQVDTKFQQIFSRSILSSIVSIAFATGQDKINGGSTTTSNNASGTSTTGDAATTATINALNRLGSVTDNFIQKFINVQPTILVDQGTPVNVFVNRDLVFPGDLGGPRVIN